MLVSLGREKNGLALGNSVDTVLALIAGLSWAFFDSAGVIPQFLQSNGQRPAPGHDVVIQQLRRPLRVELAAWQASADLQRPRYQRLFPLAAARS